MNTFAEICIALAYASWACAAICAVVAVAIEIAARRGKRALLRTDTKVLADINATIDGELWRRKVEMRGWDE